MCYEELSFLKKKKIPENVFSHHFCVNKMNDPYLNSQVYNSGFQKDLPVSADCNCEYKVVKIEQSRKISKT